MSYSVRVYILGPAALTTSSQALCVFLAIWRRRGGLRYIKSISSILHYSLNTYYSALLIYTSPYYILLILLLYYSRLSTLIAYLISPLILSRSSISIIVT